MKDAFKKLKFFEGDVLLFCFTSLFKKKNKYFLPLKQSDLRHVFV